MTPVDPAADAPLIHAWATEPRGRFWGMADHSVDEVREVYEFLDGLTTHHAYLVRLDGRPGALFQTYQPEADPIGECYDVQPGDFGVHFMMAPADKPAPGFTGLMMGVLAEFAFRDRSVRRIVVEPDARNDKAIARMVRFGFRPGELIELPHKTARLAFLDRETYEGAATSS